MAKREEIRGVTPLDIKKINDNFKWLWQNVFGNINFTDVTQGFQSRIAALENKFIGLKNYVNEHISGGSHISADDRVKWDNKADKDHKHSIGDFNIVNTAKISLNQKFNGTIECCKISEIVHLMGTIVATETVSGECIVGMLPERFRPGVDVLGIVRSSEGIAKLNIYTSGKIELDLTETAGFINVLNTPNNVSVMINFKGA